MFFKALDNQDDEGLETPFTEKKLFRALWDLNGDKTPSLNGFSTAF